MSLSALARSPECEQLLKFYLDHKITSNWDHSDIDCFVNGHILSGDIAVGETASQELVVHIQHKRSDDKCSVHLSTIIALATAHIKYQYEAVVEALSDRGQPVDWILKGEPEGIDGRLMVYMNLVVKHGYGSKEAGAYYKKHQDDNLFVDGASMIRVKARIMEIISEEEDTKSLNHLENASSKKDPEN